MGLQVGVHIIHSHTHTHTEVDFTVKLLKLKPQEPLLTTINVLTILALGYMFL